MARQPKAERKPPACYALVVPGLEVLASEEIATDLKAEVRKTERGLVVFRVPEVNEAVLALRTTEDVFLLAWGTDQLTYRALDLKSIQRWTAQDADWNQLLRLHHELRPKPKGKPTYHLVAQMNGQHGYRRMDALASLAAGLVGKLPASWRRVDEDAAIEIWLTIDGAQAVCGLRLSDRTMRHRTYKQEHVPASLRPSVAAAMIRLAEVKAHRVLLDPMCGAGTILAEAIDLARRRRLGTLQVWGGDVDFGAVRAAASNLRRVGPARLACWDACRLPLPDAVVHALVSNPPFGVQLGRPQDIAPLYRRMIPQYDRVLRPGGRAVFLVSEFDQLREAAAKVGWKCLRQLRLRVLGQAAVMSVWRKPGQVTTII